MSKATIDISELEVRLKGLLNSLAHINQLSHQKALPHVNTENLKSVVHLSGLLDFHAQEILDRQKERNENE